MKMEITRASESGNPPKFIDIDTIDDLLQVIINGGYSIILDCNGDKSEANILICDDYLE